jgi:hypothetical protein
LFVDPDFAAVFAFGVVAEAEVEAFAAGVAGCGVSGVDVVAADVAKECFRWRTHGIDSLSLLSSFESPSTGSGQALGTSGKRRFR